MRSKIVQVCADGMDSQQIARGCGCTRTRCQKWRRRFLRLRLDGLTDEERPGRRPDRPPAAATAGRPPRQ
ncbi:helix-turn-helix domain-containing protein [Nonomuraea wenchangensis]